MTTPAVGPPIERRMRQPSCDLVTIDAYAHCPFCAVEFKASTGFMSHLIVEHWCAREVALDLWLTSTDTALI